MSAHEHDDGQPDSEDVIERLREANAALQSLVDRLDEIHADPAYKSVWTSYMIHGGRYEGPTYVDALARARAALATTEKPG